MSKNEKIYIKLEVCKDSSGKLKIMAHFNNDAPNIIITKDEYTWIPSIEEKDLLNDAFGYFLLNQKTIKENITHVSPEPKEQKPILEFKKEQDIKTTEKNEPIAEVNPPIEQEPFEEKPVEEKKSDDRIEQINKRQISKDESEDIILEKTSDEKPNVFEIAVDEKLAMEEIEELKLRGEMDAKVEIKKEKINETEEPDGVTKSKKEKDEKLLREADNDAIEKALKKHVDIGSDDSMKEVDEQTIIDRVLSQKKKGKWRKIK